MRPLRVGALFAGYGGIEIALRQVLGGENVELVWYSEIDPGACRILAARFPGVPNLGDITKIGWATVPAVDVITGGSPCQDVSVAGKRKGMRAGTRSGLWASMCDGIDALRPRLVIWENVRGVLSAEADSEVEPCPGCVGDARAEPVLRALGRVLGDLADVGYDTRWYGLRAADVGACHGRHREFVFASPGDADGGCGDRWATAGQSRETGPSTRYETTGDTGPGLTLLPTPRTSDTNGAGRHGQGGPDLRTVAALLLPTPTAMDSRTTWGDYAVAMARHERMLGRPAPPPTEAGPKGGQRLSARFVEWMMCLPAGWVTDPALWADVKPGAARNAQLKALGNGVVPPQAAAAFRQYLADSALFVEWMMCLPAGWITDPALWADVKPRGRSR